MNGFFWTIAVVVAVCLILILLGCIDCIRRSSGKEIELEEKDKLRRDLYKCKVENETLHRKLSSIEAWRRACEHADRVTLDVDSAHPYIVIAPDKRSCTHQTKILPVPTNPQRFDGVAAVLGCDGFSSGNHYWEVDVGTSSDWDVGVARKSIKRKGNITLSPKEGFWVLGFTGRDYFAKTDPWTRVAVEKKPKKIGIDLNFQENKVTFFNVTDISMLFEFKACGFSEDIYPFFKNGIKGQTIFICPMN